MWAKAVKSQRHVIITEITSLHVMNTDMQLQKNEEVNGKSNSRQSHDHNYIHIKPLQPYNKHGLCV